MIAEIDIGLDISPARILLLLSVTILVGNFIYKWLAMRSRNLHPGPMGLPVLGYWPFLGEDSHKKFAKMKEKYGDVFGLYMGSTYTIIVNEYNAVKDILNNPASWDRERNVLRRLDPVGFGNLNGAEWMEQRRFSFHTAKEHGLGRGPWETIILEEALGLVKAIENTNEVPVDMTQAVRVSVSSNIVHFLTGKKLDKVSDADTIHVTQSYAEVALNYLGPARTVSVMPWLWHFLVTFRISGYHKVSEIINNFLGFIRKEVNRHKSVPELRDAQDMINTYLHKLEKISSAKDEAKHYFNERNLVGMLNAMFLGGSDTIVSSINWLLRLMALHQDIQKKVHEEILEVLGKDGIARYEERDAFPYTFAVLMEAQRFASNHPLSNSRKANQDFVYNGYEIPKGTQIIPNLWALHYDPKYWKAPERFVPERFLANDGKTLRKTMPSYAPFSIGRRNCPGETIAWMEILAYFTEIVKRFHISLAPGVEEDFQVYPGLVTHLKPKLMCFCKRE